AVPSPTKGTHSSSTWSGWDWQSRSQQSQGGSNANGAAQEGRQIEMTQQPFDNPATQKEKLEALRGLSVSEPANTMHGRAVAEAARAEGVFGVLGKVKVVSPGGPTYTRAAGHWNQCADNAVEPPLGVDVNYVEPVGTPAEVQASIAPELPSPPGATTEP